MKKRIDDTQLVELAREALARGAAPAESTFDALRLAAQMEVEANPRGMRQAAFWWWLAGAASAAAVAALLALKLPGVNALQAVEQPSERSWAEAQQSAQDHGAYARVLSHEATDQQQGQLSVEEALALMVMLGNDESLEEGGEPITEALLALQERHCGFEDAHAMYAFF